MSWVNTVERPVTEKTANLSAAGLAGQEFCWQFIGLGSFVVLVCKPPDIHCKIKTDAQEAAHCLFSNDGIQSSKLD